jgi:hypothetical protein
VARQRRHIDSEEYYLMRHPIKILVMIVACLSACVIPRDAENSEEMLKRGSALTKLSASMEALIRYGNPATAATEPELLTQGTAHDPALLTNLGSYRIRVRADDRHAIVLMCSADGKRALLEDAGCTGELDAQHWNKPALTCEFTLTAASACRQR